MNRVGDVPFVVPDTKKARVQALGERFSGGLTWPQVAVNRHGEPKLSIYSSAELDFGQEHGGRSTMSHGTHTPESLGRPLAGQRLLREKRRVTLRQPRSDLVSQCCRYMVDLFDLSF